VKSTTYETDIVEALRVSGSRTFRVDARHDRTTRERKSAHCETCTCVAQYVKTRAPAVITLPTYKRARRGSSPSFLIAVVSGRAAVAVSSVVSITVNMYWTPASENEAGIQCGV
jgi:hypothetical protein